MTNMNPRRSIKFQYWARFALSFSGIIGGPILLFLVAKQGPKQVTPASGITFAVIGLSCLFVFVAVTSYFWKCPVCNHRFGRSSSIGKCERCGANFS